VTAKGTSNIKEKPPWLWGHKPRRVTAKGTSNIKEKPPWLWGHKPRRVGDWVPKLQKELDQPGFGGTNVIVATIFDGACHMLFGHGSQLFTLRHLFLPPSVISFDYFFGGLYGHFGKTGIFAVG
jgi:hypothetical protein